MVNRKSKLAVIDHEYEQDDLPEICEPVQTENGRLAIASLVEDELLLALPQIPRKPGLQNVEYSTGGLSCETENPQAGEMKNPFAALRDILKQDEQN
jgi:uncharacterized protein